MWRRYFKLFLLRLPIVGLGYGGFVPRVSVGQGMLTRFSVDL